MVAARVRFACRESPGGERLREVPLAAYGESALVVDEWRHTSVLIWIRSGASHSLWWVFAGGEFEGWYINLEQPIRRWVHGETAGVDTIDHGLDVVATPDRRWRWKDVEEFREYTGEPGYWTAQDAEQIHAEAEQVIQALERGDFPFDGTWCDFRPDAAWLPEPLPDTGWQEPLPS